MKLIGIDGCKGGWVVATSDASLASLAFHIAPDFGTIIESLEDDTQVVVDIPIGLTEDGTRACDTRARELLGARHSSVFSTPCRVSFPARTYREACALNFAGCGKCISQQTYGILSKISEVDSVMTPVLQSCVRESHPEVVFARLAGAGNILHYNKKKVDGARERLALLARVTPAFDLEGERARLGRAKVQRDDVIDAMACLVTAHRIVTGVALSLPEGKVQRDARNLRMEIVI